MPNGALVFPVQAWLQAGERKRKRKKKMPKKKQERVNGMPVKAIKKLLKSKDTPEPIRRAWRKKLEKLGKLDRVI